MSGGDPRPVLEDDVLEDDGTADVVGVWGSCGVVVAGGFPVGGARLRFFFGFGIVMRGGRCGLFCSILEDVGGRGGDVHSCGENWEV